MTEPWFNENVFGALYGAVGGSLCGVIGGTLGGLAGWLAPKGKGRTWILGGMIAFMGLGLLNLAFGIFALVVGQPYGIWYGPLLLGVLCTVLPGCLLPVIRRRYQEAEERRLQAATLRQS